MEFIFVAFVVEWLLLDGRTFWQAQAELWAEWDISIYAGLFYFVFLIGLCPLFSYFRTRRQGLLGPNRFSFNDGGVRVESPKADSLVFWPTFKRVVFTKQRLFLFVTPASAFILPRRAFDNQAEFERWVEILRDHWLGAAK